MKFRGLFKGTYCHAAVYKNVREKITRYAVMNGKYRSTKLAILEPLRLYPENVLLCKSFSCWHFGAVYAATGSALTRLGIGSPHSFTKFVAFTR